MLNYKFGVLDNLSSLFPCWSCCCVMYAVSTSLQMKSSLRSIVLALILN